MDDRLRSQVAYKEAATEPGTKMTKQLIRPHIILKNSQGSTIKSPLVVTVTDADELRFVNHLNVGQNNKGIQ